MSSRAIEIAENRLNEITSVLIGALDLYGFEGVRAFEVDDVFDVMKQLFSICVSLGEPMFGEMSENMLSWTGGYFILRAEMHESPSLTWEQGFNECIRGILETLTGDDHGYAEWA